eukprot:TRINITY_DN36943_c0_g1_i1.p1 TRINITY_DN36943_c0_g1~~TRINITY_DN36943_c0_g1_i1.p1  ORF type:complete len:298 (-),score=23.68 TRINITY_DN36943_c0_g1_i1:20-784(-)
MTQAQVQNRGYYTPGANQAGEKQLDKVKFGPRSKYGNNWIAGPTHELYNQHVPGYQGHVPGVISENIYSKSFAKTTKKAISGKVEKGMDCCPKKRFTSTATHMFNEKQHRRFYEDPNIVVSKKDCDDYSKTTSNMRAHSVSSLLNFVSTVGYQGHSSCYRKPTTDIASGNPNVDPHFDLSATKSRWVNSETTPADFGLSPGFQRTLQSQKPINKLAVVGYTGFQVGNRSQNFYGKPWRDCTANSKRMQSLVQKH